MVYSLRCSECNNLIKFGSGEEPDDVPGKAIRWDGKVYCKDCVQKFVKLGVGDVRERIEYLEETMDEVAQTLGLEFEFIAEEEE